MRPFVHRLAAEIGLGGWVANALDGVALEVEGADGHIDRFFALLRRKAPGRVVEIIVQDRPSQGSDAFEIRASVGGPRAAGLPPDAATCAACLRELFDPADRRYRYPFISCARCGPRESILRALPYDRANTGMDRFVPCAACAAEYADPGDRRFHAQTNACAACGPTLTLVDPGGATLERGDLALSRAVAALAARQILAVKGIGGFHLMVDAASDAAVRRLRERKRRAAKPFAVMAPALAWVRAHCKLSEADAEVLTSAEAPIVLLECRGEGVAPAVAPGNPNLGVLLPYAPLHHLLLAELATPLVATSGNHSDEPLCSDTREARKRLGGIADLFLTHDRPIVSPIDDSVVRVLAGEVTVLRRARGYSAQPVAVDLPLTPVWGVGGHLKATLAAPIGDRIQTSPHIGDLDSADARAAHARARERLERLHGVRPTRLACDLHPDYGSSVAAAASGLPLTPVQHHYAHVLACLVDNGLSPPILGVAWDGSGLGDDGTLWGGEFLRVGPRGYTRVAHLRSFPLPGGERAIRDGWRAALGLLYEMEGEAAFARPHLDALVPLPARERTILARALGRGLNAPRCSSVGRLFDAVAALAGLRGTSSFEGDAAMALEFAAAGEHASGYRIDCIDSSLPIVLDWEPMVRALLDDLRQGVPIARVASGVHTALAVALVEAVRRLGDTSVVLTGGCFQNRRLLEDSVARLRSAGVSAYWHHRLPPNDGSLAVGQLIAACQEGG
jgi:hydrogenase maturation protein HypF